MDRQLSGIVAATLAAPYVVVIFLSLPALIGHLDPTDLLKLSLYESLFAVGTIVLFYTAVPILVLSLLAALALNMLKLRSPVSSLITGSLVGLCFGTFLSSSDFASNWYLTASIVLSGALCGWIYWVIASWRTPENARAIDAA